MNTRALEPADAHAVAALWTAGAIEAAAIDPAFHPRLTVAEYGASLEAELKAGAILGWGAFAVVDNTLLGYLTARPNEPSREFEQPGFLYLLDLDIRPDQRRLGIGSRLVSLARLFARAHGLGSVEVSWLSSDPRASAFWRSQGFAPYLARARGSSFTSPHGTRENAA